MGPRGRTELAETPRSGSVSIGTWPPKNIRKTFEALPDKLKKVRADQRLAVIDFWIGKLFDLRAEIAGRRWP